MEGVSQTRCMLIQGHSRYSPDRGGVSVLQVGIEYDLKFASRARERVSELGMQDKVGLSRACRYQRFTTAPPFLTKHVIQSQVSVIHGNVLDFDFEDAGAIFVYLVPKGLAALAPRLLKCLSRGVNIVSYGRST